jgi:hypothetical protein
MSFGFPQIVAQIQADRWPEVVRIWHDPSHGLGASTGMVLLWLGGLVLTLAAALWGIERLRSRQQRPLALFRRIAGEFELSWTERRLLIRVARRQGLASPLTLLMSPATFAHHISAYALAGQGADSSHLTGRAARIAAKLFLQSPAGAALPGDGEAN